jgi:hypothetical protein
MIYDLAPIILGKVEFKQIAVHRWRRHCCVSGVTTGPTFTFAI